MPTYTVTSVEGTLDAPKRAKIASAITRIHSETTGAPAYFAQVIFTEVVPDRYFVGGIPLKGQQVFVNGQIRRRKINREKKITNYIPNNKSGGGGLWSLS